MANQDPNRESGRSGRGRSGRGPLVGLFVGVGLPLVFFHAMVSRADEQAAPAAKSVADCARVRAGGLLALYDFGSADGDIVHDLSGAGEPIHLRISNLSAVARAPGSLEVRGKTLIHSATPPTRLIEAVRRSGEVSIEAWIRPANDTQKGPARIVTLSRNSSDRNITFGQDGDRFEIRLRTTRTDRNGRPPLRSFHGTLSPRRLHVVYTRTRSGRADLYVDGKRVMNAPSPGTFANWHGASRLALGNEFGKGRPWLGTFYRVALYSRHLSGAEVARHFQAGPDAPAPGTPTVEPSSLTAGPLTAGPLMTGPAEVPTGPAQSAAAIPRADLFEKEIAPLLARHCLECHDTSTRKGRLDLSRRETAFVGGKHGEAIIPGNATESLIWQSVESGKMPKRRPALSEREQNLLRDWIDAGAPWTVETIDLSAASIRQRPPGSTWLQRLTVEEYIATVRSSVGIDISGPARDLLPPDVRADGFSNTAYNLNVDLGLIDAYAQLATAIVERMDVVTFAARFSDNKLLTDDGMRGLIGKVGLWLLRGPLTDDEIAAFRGISTTVASSGGDFPEVLRYVVEAMLQAPRFVYRIENQRGDGTTYPISDYELASRLSYILWGGPPDEELMRAIDEGRLYDCDDVSTQVRRMLEDPRAIDRSCRFLHEWLDLDRLDHLRPHPDHFPGWDARLAADMRRETLAFFRELAWEQKRPLTDLLNAQSTWLTPRLAEHYRLGLTPDASGSGAAKNVSASTLPGGTARALARYDLSAVPGRGGLLTHGSVLTVGGDEASMVSRGLFVLRDLLRGSVQDPPPCVDTTPVPTRLGLTQRGIAEERLANPACGGCHAKFEPLAFGLERFDGLGAYHVEDEHGNPLRDDGEVLFPGTDTAIAYTSSAELMDLLAASDRVAECLTWKVTQFALGRPLSPTDAPILSKIHETARQAGGTYTSLITAIVMSDLVQLGRTEGDGRSEDGAQ